MPSSNTWGVSISIPWKIALCTKMCHCLHTMVAFALWLQIASFWFKGPEYQTYEQCSLQASKIRDTVPNTLVLCSPRGFP